ncbi:UV DNA damage repair endonuclease UvsE [Desulfobacula toluolica]|uniref:UvdE: UV-endonuclease n=1 Tax=Desulfobacula toluolica (strain DSM 7467 / Tol2) TaxID=651182 RepID=K0NF02_DESTT|nr:UV DNA damage repair endonuclease UvsE [Desulfobacula toluolica]CCK78198.1 UvdE: UV-endonuclease [Desulfobacula toluolica Tol2]
MDKKMIRFGLCCIFKEHPIKFRKTTAKYLSKFSIDVQKKRLSDLCLTNARNLLKALEFCYHNKIGAFRINSQIMPLKTHPDVGYDIDDLPGSDHIIKAFRACGAYSLKNNIRTSFHPDQFIVLSSPNPNVVKRSVAELNYQTQVAQWVNADVINIHAGGVYGDKPAALKRLAKTIENLDDPVRKRLTLENDDKSYTPEDLFPVCHDMKIPLVYDVHHHRCLKDRFSIEQATKHCVQTWDREPLFHISSPKDGWGASNIRKHHDYIDKNDLPAIWLSMDITIEVEAKAKELAIRKLMKELNML